jgi:hypothetical protein
VRSIQWNYGEIGKLRESAKYGIIIGILRMAKWFNYSGSMVCARPSNHIPNPD